MSHSSPQRHDQPERPTLPGAKILYRDIGVGCDYPATIIRGVERGGELTLELSIHVPGCADPVALSRVPWSSSPRRGAAFFGGTGGEASSEAGGGEHD